MIDDDQAIRDLVTQFLEVSAHCDVVAVPSAREALVALGEADVPFDGFLIDIQMPGVDGISLVKIIRETKGYEDKPIVMLTAMREKSYLRRAVLAGATDYVTKPFDFADLLSRFPGTWREAPEAVAGHHAGAPDGANTPEVMIALDDPIPLPGIEAAIDYGAFENHVRELQRQRLFQATAIAVKISAVEEVHTALAPEAFEAVLAASAQAISTSILPGGGLLTYRGGGVFLCIPENPLLGRRKEMQQALNTCYQRDHPDAALLAPDLLVGDQVPFGARPGLRVLDCLTRSVAGLDTETEGQLTATWLCAPRL